MRGEEADNKFKGHTQAEEQDHERNEAMPGAAAGAAAGAAIGSVAGPVGAAAGAVGGAVAGGIAGGVARSGSHVDTPAEARETDPAAAGPRGAASRPFDSSGELKDVPDRSK